MQGDSTPPIGDHEQAEKYITQIISAVRSGNFDLVHSDLSKFDPSSFQDHYRLDMGEFHAEVSHSKHPQSGSDIFSLIFTSVDKMRQGQTNQAILSYLPLTAEQFSKFKSTAEAYFAEQKRLAEEKRFKSAMQPIDSLLKTDLPNHSDNSVKPDHPQHHRSEQPDNRDNHNPPKTDTPDDSQFFHQFSLNSKPVAGYTAPQDFPKN